MSMAEVHDMQKKVLGMQNTDEVNSIFSEMISGKAGYKTVVEMKKEPIKCRNCDLILGGDEKFCPECGQKVEKEESEEKNN